MVLKSIPPNQTYTIMINERQRQIILMALTGSTVTDFRTDPGTGCGAYDTEQEEFIALVQMFGTLPTDQKGYPDTLVHGFCL